MNRATDWTETVKRGEMLRQAHGPGVLVPREVRWVAATTEARGARLQAQAEARLVERGILPGETRRPPAPHYSRAR